MTKTEALKQLLAYAERELCYHEETHRGGAIWEICDSCGAQWADDEGGKPPFEEPIEIQNARAALEEEEASVDELRQSLEGASKLIQSMTAELNAAMEKKPLQHELFAKVEKFLQHLPTCDIEALDDTCECSCGLDQILLSYYKVGK